ncbi:MAG: DUF488 domain-containing protein [Acidobacteriales bacterium]|nr:DUF488 domain-containing protein [Terriglobales bacterium]
MATLYTIGHSTHTLEEFIGILNSHSIKALADIRSFPGSRRLPHFNRESLEESLSAAGILYFWVPELGGRRKKSLEHSPHTNFRNDSFRNYADHMMTAEFQQGASKLLELAEKFRTAYMCAESVYFKCHRMLVSDWLVAHGHEILHISGTGPAKPHKQIVGSRMVDGQLIYAGDTLF